MRVLYVDDDRLNTLLFAETCRVVGGVELETAGSAGEAIDVVASWAPDVLVIDLHLPDANGYDLLPLLRDRLHGRAPAFLCTADDRPLVEQPARAAGFDGCWCKPVDLASVRAELERLAAMTR